MVADPQLAATKVHAGQVPGGIQLADRGGQDDPSVFAQADGGVHAAQDLRQGAAGGHAALVQHHQVVGQARHLVRRVADVEHGDVELVAQALQIGQDFLLATQVERGQGLVHQQHARGDGQGAGDADALTLAPRQMIGLPVEQGADAQQVDDVVQVHLGRLGAAAQAIAQVAQHAEVREKAGLLKHIADGAAMGGQPCATVLPGLALHAQASLRRTLQPGDTAQKGRLARA